MFVSYPCRQLCQFFFPLHFMPFYFPSNQIFSSVLALLTPCLFFSSWNNKSCFEAAALQKWDIDIYILCKWEWDVFHLHLPAPYQGWIGHARNLARVLFAVPHTSLGLWGRMKLSSPQAVGPKTRERDRQGKNERGDGESQRIINERIFQRCDPALVWMGLLFIMVHLHKRSKNRSAWMEFRGNGSP